MASTWQKLFSILPHFTGLASWLGSFTIVVDIIRRKYRSSSTANKPKTYHRLMLGMSFCDICVSAGSGLTTWPAPRETGAYGAIGNYGTCQAQAFFNVIGIGTPLYNLCLAIYYYRTIVNNQQTSVLVERTMHIFCLGFAIGAAISGLPLKIYGYAIFWCFITSQHDNFRWAYWYGPLWFSIFVVAMIMLAIYYNIRKKEIRQDRWSWATQRSLPVQRQRSKRASDSVKWQAFCYVGSFFVTWVFLTSVRVMQAAGRGPGEIPNWVVLVAVTLAPFQGFLNFLVYITPRYKKHRQLHPEVGRLATFLRVNPLYDMCKCGRGVAVQSFGGRSSNIYSSVQRRISLLTRRLSSVGALERNEGYQRSVVTTQLMSNLDDYDSQGEEEGSYTEEEADREQAQEINNALANEGDAEENKSTTPESRNEFISIEEKTPEDGDEERGSPFKLGLND